MCEFGDSPPQSLSVFRGGRGTSPGDDSEQKLNLVMRSLVLLPIIDFFYM